jgi:ribonuclease J
MNSTVRITFLGGLGEIGRNCAAFELDDRIILLDCGLMFPEADMPGVDLVLPDFTWLRENAHRVDGCILTHGTRTTPAPCRSSCGSCRSRSTARG